MCDNPCTWATRAVRKTVLHNLKPLAPSVGARRQVLHGRVAVVRAGAGGAAAGPAARLPRVQVVAAARLGERGRRRAREAERALGARAGAAAGVHGHSSGRAREVHVRGAAGGRAVRAHGRRAPLARHEQRARRRLGARRALGARKRARAGVHACRRARRGGGRPRNRRLRKRTSVSWPRRVTNGTRKSECGNALVQRTLPATAAPAALASPAGGCAKNRRGAAGAARPHPLSVSAAWIARIAAAAAARLSSCCAAARCALEAGGKCARAAARVAHSFLDPGASWIPLPGRCVQKRVHSKRPRRHSDVTAADAPSCRPAASSMARVPELCGWWLSRTTVPLMPSVG